MISKFLNREKRTYCCSRILWSWRLSHTFEGWLLQACNGLHQHILVAWRGLLRQLPWTELSLWFVSLPLGSLPLVSQSRMHEGLRQGLRACAFLVALLIAENDKVWKWARAGGRLAEVRDFEFLPTGAPPRERWLLVLSWMSEQADNALRLQFLLWQYLFQLNKLMRTKLLCSWNKLKKRHLLTGDFNNHHCSETASQAIPQGSSHANATGGKVGFKMATKGIQFHLFCQLS